MSASPGRSGHAHSIEYLTAPAIVIHNANEPETAQGHLSHRHRLSQMPVHPHLTVDQWRQLLDLAGHSHPGIGPRSQVHVTLSAAVPWVDGLGSLAGTMLTVFDSGPETG